MIIAREGNTCRQLNVSPIEVLSQVDLPLSEARRALEISFALRGVKVVPVGTDALKAVPWEKPSSP